MLYDEIHVTVKSISISNTIQGTEHEVHSSMQGTEYTYIVLSTVRYVHSTQYCTVRT